MRALNCRIDRLADRLERATWLNPPAEKVSAVAARLLPDGPVKNTATGTPLGHPLHPALVTIPMGCWLSAAYLDCAPLPRRIDQAATRRIAQRMVGLGLLAAIPTVIAGASDWLDTAEAERRVGLVHAVANWGAIAGYTASWLLRRAGRHRSGAAVSTASIGLLGLGGWLGAHLVYAMGVGVDTTAFQKLPSRWTDAGLEFDELTSGSAVAVEVGGVSVLISRSGRSVHAIANRCTHRGGPLDEGEIADGCVTCPWHGSRFDLADGSVQKGPATRPQPTLEARVSDGRVQVRRRDEVRALRLNPVGG
jgi:nitrite reductase/ring-hydroxylating ferredoxin subunit/uncharacterized membrane protein